MPYNWAFPLTLGSAMASMLFGKDKHSTRSMLGMVTKSALEVMTPFGQEENLAAVLAPGSPVARSTSTRTRTTMDCRFIPTIRTSQSLTPLAAGKALAMVGSTSPRG
jgi:hypothetical protein